MTQGTRLPLDLELSPRQDEQADSSPSASGPHRAIVHLDLDAFYASVELRENPGLTGRPVLVGGRPDKRGVVAAASYEAREYGVHSAMPMARAVRLCPQAVVIPPRFDVYRRYSRRVMAILHEATALVERISIDEAYLDLTEQVDQWEEVVSLARRLQQRVRDEVGLSASLGVATNKLVAKVASDYDKPGGLTVVRPGEGAAFLEPLPVRVIWGIGPVTAQKLADMGVTTVGDLAQLSVQELAARFGEHGAAMARRCRGIDHRPVVTEHERKSVSRERTFSRDLRDLEALKKQLWRLSQGVAQRLKQTDAAAGTIAVKLRYDDFETLTRQMSLDVPTGDEVRIYRAALVLLKQAWECGRPVRLLGVGGSDLKPPTGQMPLF
ncbi:MAG: DNA polymerase IV [Chloroflexota bacterium]|nr:DNA polymerase IV [Chloroflexota bacterium]